MVLYSTNGSSPNVTFEEAIFQGLPPDNGLYMPLEIPKMSEEFWENVEKMTFNEMALEISHALLGDSIPKEDIQELLSSAINFRSPVTQLTEDLFCLELFHGPSMAFKDFGARFMAATMSYFLQKSGKKLNILVATSGDTGGAVAQGFYDVSGISVTILYPKGRVSDIQEKQLTTLGKNIKALEVNGSFDDCQALVKKAFLDQELREAFNLASANSINIARLIPQVFYYVSAYAQLKHLKKEIVISVPSGNFGNLTAGLIAIKLGAPIKQFIAATNANKVVPEFLHSGKYKAISPSISTISNAMDVGNPSNFPRLMELFKGDIQAVRTVLEGYDFSDEQTREAVLELYQKYNYLACPHTGVAYLGLKALGIKENQIGVFLCTAHYGKFLPEMESILGFTPIIPERLILLGNKKTVEIEPDYGTFKRYLLQNLI